ncbi:MAG: CDP-glycerol glycerophosphotransferase family protein [Treponema sp.]|nr:CDP-glycerol glycerophosphotransferase family protein [Treponema sp.]
MKKIKSYTNSVKVFISLLVDIPFLLFWKLEQFLPRNKKLWVFSSWFGNRYSDSSRAFYEYVTNNDKSIRCVWILKNKVLVEELKSKNIEAYSDNSLSAMFIKLCAGNFFSITGDEFSLRLINGANFYEIWHGMPLKQILNDDDLSVGGDGKIGRLKKKLTCFKWNSFLWYKKLFTCTSSDFFTPILSSAFALSPEKILKTGLPRCDKLFSPNKEQFVENLRNKYPACKIILYMPTFRTSSWTGEVFNPFSEEYNFDINAFHEVLSENNYVLLFKPHYYDLKVLSNKETSDRFITIGDEDFDDLYSLLGQIDILMTDYSSVYFDFIPTKKPVILAPFDMENYTNTARKLYFSYSEIDGIKGNNWNEVLTILKNRDYRPATENAIKKFSKYIDGKCSEKLYRLIIGEK